MLALVSAALVGLMGLAGVVLTAYAGLRSNRLRVESDERREQAETERDEASAEAARRSAEAEALRAERAQLAADRAALIRELTAENTRLRRLLAAREDRP